MPNLKNITPSQISQLAGRARVMTVSATLLMVVGIFVLSYVESTPGDQTVVSICGGVALVAGVRMTIAAAVAKTMHAIVVELDEIRGGK